MHFAKFLMLRFSKYHYHSFQFQPDFMENVVIMGNTGYYFFNDLPKFQKKKIWHVFVKTYRTIWGWKFEKTTPPTLFIRSQPNVIRVLATIVEYRLLLLMEYRLLQF